jgi:hypothetical protein
MQSCYSTVNREDSLMEKQLKEAKIIMKGAQGNTSLRRGGKRIWFTILSIMSIKTGSVYDLLNMTLSRLKWHLETAQYVQTHKKH